MDNCKKDSIRQATIPVEGVRSCIPVGNKNDILRTRSLSVSCSNRPIIQNITISIPSHQVFGIIGPSGAGKTTLLKCLNRLIDLSPTLKVEGDVIFRNRSVFVSDIDVNHLRSRIGMLFQQPVVFPKSIYENVLFGVRYLRKIFRSLWPEIVEQALRRSALWGEVKDRLREPANCLSVGQQQRLSLARTLAVQPEIILMDEPTSSLDPKSSRLIEELILTLKQSITIVLVTHNLQQARRLTDWVACICMRDGVGEIAESACCDALFSSPMCQHVVDYLDSANYK